jgi:hypothetical protein
MPQSSSDADTYDTIIDKIKVLKVAEDQIETFKSLLPADIKPEKAPANRKRKIEPDDSGIDWEMMFRESRLSEIKNLDLKKKFRSVGEAVSGNKQVSPRLYLFCTAMDLLCNKASIMWLPRNNIVQTIAFTLAY